MPTVLVTGAARGLGLELVRQYLADGWSVLACVRDLARAGAIDGLASGAAGRLEILPLELDRHETVDALATRLDGRPIDVLLSAAGTMGQGNFAAEGLAFGRFGHSDFADWQHVLRVNAIGPMKVAEAFVEHVAASQQKKIVALTSIVGSIARNSVGSLYAYRASKAALNAIMRSMAIDLHRSHGILAAPVHPGWVQTDMGGPKADIDVGTSIRGIRAVIAGLDATRAGRFWMYDGTELPW